MRAGGQALWAGEAVIRPLNPAGRARVVKRGVLVLWLWSALCDSGPPWWLAGTESSCDAGDAGDIGSSPWVGKISWRRARQPTSVFSAGESHGQRRLQPTGSHRVRPD